MTVLTHPLSNPFRDSVFSPSLGGDYERVVNLSLPIASGSGMVGTLLEVTDGDWSGNPYPAITYQWYREPDTEIEGATSNQYEVKIEDDGEEVYCVITATNFINSVSFGSNSILCFE